VQASEKQLQQKRHNFRVTKIDKEIPFFKKSVGINVLAFTYNRPLMVLRQMLRNCWGM